MMRTYEIGNFDFSTAGTKKITVSYRGKETQFTVEVKVKSDGNIQAPAAPKIKKGTCTYNSIQIKWDKVNGASGYEIYRSTSKNGSYNLIKTIDKQGTTNFKNTKLSFNKTYYYKVKAYTKSGATVAASGFSNILKAKTALTKPTVKAKKKSGSSINVSWKKVAGASGYQFQYSLKKKSGYKSININKKNAKSYTLKNLEPKKTYYVKVRAFRKVKSKKVYGSWSKVETAKLR